MSRRSPQAVRRAAVPRLGCRFVPSAAQPSAARAPPARSPHCSQGALLRCVGELGAAARSFTQGVRLWGPLCNARGHSPWRRTAPRAVMARTARPRRHPPPQARTAAIPLRSGSLKEAGGGAKSWLTRPRPIGTARRARHARWVAAGRRGNGTRRPLGRAGRGCRGRRHYGVRTVLRARPDIAHTCSVWYRLVSDHCVFHEMQIENSGKLIKPHVNW